MSHGGKRDGAGKPKGAINKRTRAQIERAISSGEMPLDYMLRRMRDPTVDYDKRDEMAKAAAPYIHSKPTATEAKPVDVSDIGDVVIGALLPDFTRAN